MRRLWTVVFLNSPRTCLQVLSILWKALLPGITHKPFISIHTQTPVSDLRLTENMILGGCLFLGDICRYCQDFIPTGVKDLSAGSLECSSSTGAHTKLHNIFRSSKFEDNIKIGSWTPSSLQRQKTSEKALNLSLCQAEI